MQHAYDEILRQERLPGVGQIVRSKKDGLPWRAMEKREIRQNVLGDSKNGLSRRLPDRYLVYWRVGRGMLTGLGKILGYSNALRVNTFAANWEIVEE